MASRSKKSVPPVTDEAQASPLTDGTGRVAYYVAQGGSPSSVLTLTIRIPDHTDPTSVAVTKDGPDAAAFTVSALSGTSIPVGAGTLTFTVTFTSGSVTGKSAALHPTFRVHIFNERSFQT